MNTELAQRLPESLQALLAGKTRLRRTGRKVAVLAHLLVIGVWLGSAFALLVLSVFGRFSSDHRTIHGAYVIFDFFDVWVMPTVGALALITGFTLAIGTNFGVLVHRWVVFKIVLAGIVLISAWQLMQPWVRDAKERTSYDGPTDLAGLDTTIFVFATAFNLALWVIMTVSVIKPWGRTRFGDAMRAQKSQTTS